MAVRHDPSNANGRHHGGGSGEFMQEGPPGQRFGGPATAGQGTVRSIEAVPCAQPHDAQVIGISMLTDDSYDDATVKSEADDTCQKMASGITVDQTKLGNDANIVDFTPTADSWGNGDRRVTCAVDNGTGNRLTGSVMK
ncbi:septum formation family protein [Kitasatospora sp. NPDC052896]|uniref:septum formation family protein n=1 Tax=Kitasatospora sp. NPDC052896 TaxID=3364061 RepID=UPI0037CB58E4